MKEKSKTKLWSYTIHSQNNNNEINLCNCCEMKTPHEISYQLDDLPEIEVKIREAYCFCLYLA